MRAAGTAPTRRQLLGGLALGLAGPAGAAWAKSAPVQSGGDAEVLRRMLEVEQFAVFAYRRALASGTLSMRAKPVVGLILGHEQEHVRMLVRALAARGGGFPVLPDCARAGSRPGTVNPCELHSQKESLSLLLDVEEACEAVYYHGLSKLKEEESRNQAGQMFEQVGLRPGRPLAIATGLAEVFAGVSAVLGFLTRPAALAVIVTQGVAIAKVHAKIGFDITNGGWSDELCDLMRVPKSALPEVRPNSGDFGRTNPDAFLHLDLPIAGAAGDQQAALFGQACFTPGMSKCTYGTGSFVLVNTGTSPVRSDAGLLTTAGIADRVLFLMDGKVAADGTHEELLAHPAYRAMLLAFDDGHELAKFAATVGLSLEEFRRQFAGLIQDELPAIHLGPKPLPEGRAAIESL